MEQHTPGMRGHPSRTRRRVVRRLAGISLTLSGVVALGVAWLYARAGPGECQAVRRSDLSLEQMGSVKRRLDQYEGDPSRPLSLSGEELTFLLADNLAYPVAVAVDDEEVSAQLSLREVGTHRCYHIDFRGQVAVEQGVATLRPSRLAVGRLDLSWWLAGRELRVDPNDLTGERAGHLLSQVRMLRVAEGQLELDLQDVGSLNPRSAASRSPSIRAER